MSDSNLLAKCCLVADRVGGDPTHFMAESALESVGLDWRFLSFRVEPERVADALAGADALGFHGVRLRGRYADRPPMVAARTERATRTGRLTHLTRHEGALQGDDATGPALVESFAASLGDDACDPAGKRVLVLGAGGAAPSVVDVLVERGASYVGVADRSADRAAAVVLGAQRARDTDARPVSDALAADVQPLAWEAEWLEWPDGVDWVVSTASWPKEDNAAVAKAVGPDLEGVSLVVDLGVGASRSPLLLAAEGRGAGTLDGLPLLVAETALALEAWTGEAIDRATIREAAEEFLGF
ncbi:MAG: hypothetical protein AAF805_08325 [Planctomycetota bacterium]